MPMGPSPPSPASWNSSTAPIPGTPCQFGYGPWARWSEPPYTDLCCGGLPCTCPLEGNWRSCPVFIWVLVPTWRDWEGVMLVKPSQQGTRWDSNSPLTGAPITGWHREAGSSSSLCQRPGTGPVLGIRGKHPRGSLPAARTCLLVLRSPPAQPQEQWVGFSSLSWLFLVLESSFFSFPIFKFCMLFYSHGSFLNICICWTIAYFFKSPYPSESWKIHLVHVHCLQAKRKKKKGKKVLWKEKNTQLNIFWINIWYFF